GSERHAEILRDALAPMGLPLLGVLHRDALISAPSRHLGLVPVAEQGMQAARIVEELARRVGQACDTEAITRIAASAPALDAKPWAAPPAGAPAAARACIAIAAGPAFSFLYAENLELLAAAGADIAVFDPTTDERLPDGADALYLGGGFPEAHAPALSANTSLRSKIADFVRAGRPVLAECGGLLYLCESLDGLPMCGVIHAQAHMTEQLTLGYREAVAAADSLWARGAVARGHEFHYSTVVPNSGQQAAWQLADGEREGFVVAGVHASYLHTHWAASPQVAGRFVAAAARQAVTA
ncbi:MAG TPA: cobyrinate a,c-diamide synthase, partial [Egibacteraceae bacterium]|nr:cobyrinate a,c-diamide synthase [Egibacteraceae bacterium]